MTLVLSLLTRHYALQVSDRLVTRGTRPFDALSNKNVIYHARDAIVTIGYSGLAYLEDVPTDKWIAQRLRGEEFQERFAFYTGAVAHWLDIGQSVELIRNECQTVFSQMNRSMLIAQQFVVAGWQWRRGLARPVAWVIANDENPTLTTFGKHSLPRYWHYEWPPRFHLCSIPMPGPLSKGELTGLTKHLEPMVTSSETSQNALVDAVRLAARKYPTVGPDCMCILIPPPRSRAVHVRYAPTVQPKAVMTGVESQEADLPAAFSPWFVGPGCVAAPSILVGTQRVESGDFTVYLEAPRIPPGSSTWGAVSSQRRPPPPPT